MFVSQSNARKDLALSLLFHYEEQIEDNSKTRRIYEHDQLHQDCGHERRDVLCLE